MSTRSCVAIPQGDGWKGRYVHSDGYPDHMLPTLMDLVQRKGLDRTIDVLINWNGGWSFVGTYEGITNYLGEDRAHFVSDYGLAYTKKEQPLTEWITSEDGDPLWIEYVYILGPKSITVLESYMTDEIQNHTLADGREYKQNKYAWRLLSTHKYSDTLVSI